MKLDKLRAGSMAGSQSPADALWQIRRETRPRVIRVQRKWRRRAALRRWGHRVERACLWTLGVAGVVLAGMAVGNLLAMVLGAWPW